MRVNFIAYCVTEFENVFRGRLFLRVSCITNSAKIKQPPVISIFFINRPLARLNSCAHMFIEYLHVYATSSIIIHQIFGLKRYMIYLQATLPQAPVGTTISTSPSKLGHI